LLDKMLWEAPFLQVTGMFPGGAGGLGAGVGVNFGGRDLNLIALHAKFVADRHPPVGPQEIDPAILAAVSGTFDVLMLVVDPACDAGLQAARCDLSRVLDRRWTPRHVPVLILNCGLAAPAYGCLDFAHGLCLGAVEQPWLVQQTSLSETAWHTPVYEGLTWLLQQESATGSVF
jgi:hypothetical protein